MVQLLTSIDELVRSGGDRQAAQGCVVALGMFDGVHRGHQVVLHQTVERARARGVLPAVFTFANHPRHLLAQATEPPVPLLTPAAEKAERLTALGLERIALLPFDLTLQTLSADAFERDILAKGLGALEVLAGEDFRYGQGRAGTSERLRQAGASLGFAVDVISLVSEPDDHGQPVKLGSRKIRDALLAGQLVEANHWLGRSYTLSGEVEPGQQRGGPLLGVPTANLHLPADKLIPKAGVYAGQAEWNGQHYCAVANVGLNPTFAELRQPRVEVHLLDYAGPAFYGQRVTFSCEHYLREERAFGGLDALKTQIADDIQQARTLLFLESATVRL